MFMNRILFFLSIVIVASCNSIGAKPEIMNEIFEPTLDSLYIQCKDLKGLGNLHIGKTTLRQVQRDKGITIPEILRDATFVNGYWGVSALSDYELGQYLDRKATIIKQFEVSDFVNKYRIGELEIEKVCCAFYRDTLVAISFDCTEEILNHYIGKYGNGKGSKYTYTYRKGNYGDRNYTFENKHIEERLWANKDVTMEYKKHWHQRTAPNERDMVYGTESCVISSNSRYDDFLNELDKHKKAYKEQKEAKTKASYDSL